MIRNRLFRGVFFLIGLSGLVVLAWLWLLAHHAIMDGLHSEGGKYTARLVKTVDIPSGVKDLPLGRAELGQRPGPSSAERTHVRITDGDTGWTLRNVALYRQVLLKYDGFGEVFARRWPLAQGDLFSVAGQVFRVRNIKPRQFVELETDGHRYRLSHRGGYRSGIEIDPASRSPWLDEEACDAEQGVFTPVKRWLASFEAFEALQRDKERVVVTFGGSVECPDRVAVPKAQHGSLALTYLNGALFLRPGTGDRADLLICPVGTGCSQQTIQTDGIEFSEIEWPLSIPEGETLKHRIDLTSRLQLGEVRTVILGKTRYRVKKQNNGVLSLEADLNQHRFFHHTLNRGAASPEKHSVALMNVSEDRFEHYLDDLQFNMSERVNKPHESYWQRVEEDRRTGLSRTIAFVKGALRGKEGGPLGMSLKQIGVIVLGGVILWFFLRIRKRSRDVEYGFFLESEYLSVRLLLLAGNTLFVLFFIGFSGTYYDEQRSLLGDALVAQWGIVTLMMLLTRESRLYMIFFWLVMSIVIAIGSLTLELLSLGSPSTAWMRFDYKQLQMLSIVFYAVGWLSVLHMEVLRSVAAMATHPQSLRHVFLVRGLPLLVVTGLFLYWLIAGKEEGVGSIQPVEPGKFMAVLIFAVVVSHLDHSRRYANFYTRIGSFLKGIAVLVAYFVTIFMLIPALKSDYSPVLILVTLGLLMMIWVGFWLLLDRKVRNSIMRARRMPPPGGIGKVLRARRGLGIEWTVIVVSGLAALVLYVLAAAEVDRVRETHLTSAAYEFNTPQERVAVWLDLEKHPELGDQLINSKKLIGSTPCYHWERLWSQEWLGLRHGCDEPAFGINPDQAQGLAAVQDDFVMAFYINRFGVTGAVVLLIAQLLVVWLMVDTAVRKYSWESGDYLDDAFRQVLSFVVLGGAGLLVLHWVISWGNVFGILPIMGQPMTWLSSGNSHLLGMATPILISTLILLRFPDERPKHRVKQIHTRPMLNRRFRISGWWGRISDRLSFHRLERRRTKLASLGQ